MTDSRVSNKSRAAVVAVDRFVLWLSRHWLLLFNLAFGLYAGLPVLAPLLMSWGWTRSANIIYLVYGFLCHQLPTRCFYIGRFQVGLCERDLALYGGACLAGVAFTAVRDRVRPLPIPVGLLLMAPLVLDGITQLFGFRSSTWQLRTITGLLASGGGVWMIYPYLEQAFREVQQSASIQLSKAASSGEDRA